MTRIARKDLDNILSRDPDGWEAAPTRKDYQAFRVWVTATYGRSVWNSYLIQHASL
jgi:hypothetical protein